MLAGLPLEQIRAFKLDARRNSTAPPVVNALDATRAFVVPKQFGNTSRPAEPFNKLTIFHTPLNQMKYPGVNFLCNELR